MTAVVLLSGGLDSAVCLALACNEVRKAPLDFEVAMQVRAAAQGNERSQAWLNDYDARSLPNALFIDYGQLHANEERLRAQGLAERYGVSLYVGEVTLPQWKPNPADPTMLVPGRNLVLVSLAATIGSPVVIGCNADDYEVYKDCRPEFFEALPVGVETPLIDKSKVEIGVLTHSLGIPADATWSCYYPANGIPCEKCDACAGRRKASP